MSCRDLSRPVALLAIVAFLAACASPRSVTPIETHGASYAPARDEVNLWNESRVEEQKFLDNAVLYGDPLLQDYLQDVAANLTGPGMASQSQVQVRLRILADPALNAFAYPTGSIYLHTGLLARLENEDQLAGVVAHELTHVDERHLLKYRRSAKRKALGFTLAALAASVIIAGEAGHEVGEGHYGKAARVGQVADILLGLGLQLAFIAAINGYGRDLERSADQGAIRRMRMAGYRPEELEHVFDLLLDDHGDSTKLETFFFGSHPRLKERKADTRAMLAEAAPATTGTGEPREEACDRFERRLRPVLKDDARMNLEAGRYQLAEDEVHRALAIIPEDPDALYLLGKIRLTRAESQPDSAGKLREAARGAFLRATEADPDFAPPYREMGLLEFQQDYPEEACHNFLRYLELDPKAEDAPRIRDYVLELRSAGHCP